MGSVLMQVQAAIGVEGRNGIFIPEAVRIDHSGDISQKKYIWAVH